MLRINVHNEGESTRFRIEGKLTAKVASELEGCWHAALERQLQMPIVVDLTAVSFVDAESTVLLTRMRRQGVRLVPTGCMIREFVEQIEGKVITGGTALQGQT